MSEATHDSDPSELEREHRDVLALAEAVSRAATRDWQDVALGRAELDEVAAQRAEAGDDPEALARAKQLFRPFDDLEDARMIDALLGAVAQPTAQPDTPADPAQPSREHAERRFLIAVTLVAIAAVLVFTLVAIGSSLRGSGDPLEPIAALPSYTVDPGEGLATKRSTPADERLRYTAANTYDWIVRPGLDVAGPLPRVFAVARDAASHDHPLALRFETAATGTMRATGSVGELGLALGEWTVVLTLVRSVGVHVEVQTLEFEFTLAPPD